MLNNPFALNPLSEARTPQQERLFDYFFGDEKRHAVIHGPECGATVGGLALAVENILQRERDTVYVVPAVFKPIKLITEAVGYRVKSANNTVTASGSGAQIHFFQYEHFTSEIMAGVKWGSVDLIIDSTWAYLNTPEQLLNAIDALQPDRMMTFDRAALRQYPTGLTHPLLKVIERYNCRVVNLPSTESPLMKPESLAFYRQFAAQQGYDVQKYIAGELF